MPAWRSGALDISVETHSPPGGSHDGLRDADLHAPCREDGRGGEALHRVRLPALQKGGQDKKLIGYFQADTGMINQLVHLWKFDDDADRRAHWKSVFANQDFVEGFAVKFRPLVAAQEVKLLTAAPWGPHP